MSGQCRLMKSGDGIASQEYNSLQIESFVMVQAVLCARTG